MPNPQRTYQRCLMKRKTPAAAVLITAIVSIAVLYGIALTKDIDGALFMPVIAVIALIAGVKVNEWWNGKR